MKKISLSIVVTVSLLSLNVNAGMWQDTKETLNKTAFWKSKHLECVDFKHIYPKPLHEKSYFGFALTGTVVVAAGAFSYFTAGAGAPVAATGVAATAAWVGGGGAGSYMVGLSTVGGWFGGNAMLGSAILNGISFGVIGGTTTKFATLGILAKAGIMASVTAAGLDGVFYFSNPDTKQMEYKVRVTIPRDLGSKKTRSLVNHIYDKREEINEAIENNNELRIEYLHGLIEIYNEEATELLNKHIYQTNNQEDLIVLGIMAWNNNEQELFNKAISKIDSSVLENNGFLNYLYALQELSKGDEAKALSYLQNSIDENSYAIEPVLLSVNILGNNNFEENEQKILKLVEDADDNFDSDKYASEFGLVPLYYRVGTFYFNNKRYVKAEQFYQIAKDEMGVLQRNFFGKKLVHIIDLGIANSLYEQGKKVKASKVYNNIIEDIDTDEEKIQLESQFIGNQK